MAVTKLTKLLTLALLTLTLPTAGVAQQPFENIGPQPDTSADDDDQPVRPIERPRPPAGGRPGGGPGGPGDGGAPRPQRPQDDFIGFNETDQDVEVRERYAGWQEASPEYNSDNRVGERLRSNWVMVDRNGEFNGIVRPLEGAEVGGMTIYLMNKGRLVKSVAVQEDGTFRFTNMQRGAYGMVGWGDKGFFTFGINVLSHNDDAADSMPTTLMINAFQNVTTINTDWIRYFAQNVSYRVYGAYTTGEGSDDPAELYGFEGLSRHQPEADPSTSIGAVPVSLSLDGQLVGRVHQMNSLSGRPVEVRSTKVMLLQGDAVVASTSTDNFGVFAFEDVAPGSFGLVAASVDGLGCVGIEVVDDMSSVMDDDGEITDANQGESDPFDFCLVPSETVGWLNHYANEVAYRRAILAPRPPKPPEQQFNDFNMANTSGCSEQRKAACRRLDLTFEQWTAMGCSCCGSDEPPLRRISKGIREGVQTLNNRFEGAFYDDTGNGISGGVAPGQNQAFNQQTGQPIFNTNLESGSTGGGTSLSPTSALPLPTN